MGKNYLNVKVIQDCKCQTAHRRICHASTSIVMHGHDLNNVDGSTQSVHKARAKSWQAELHTYTGKISPLFQTSKLPQDQLSSRRAGGFSKADVMGGKHGKAHSKACKKDPYFVVINRGFRKEDDSLQPATLDVYATRQWVENTQRASVTRNRSKRQCSVSIASCLFIDPVVAEFFVSIFRHLKLELLTQFPASNDEKY